MDKQDANKYIKLFLERRNHKTIITTHAYKYGDMIKLPKITYLEEKWKKRTLADHFNS